MSRTTLTGALLTAVGVAHLIPATAVVSRRRVETTYGITVPDADTELLLRHRAVLFGIVGVDLLAAAANPRHRPAAIAIGAASVSSYLALAVANPPTNERLDQVKRVDIGLLGLLGAAAAMTRRSGGRDAG